MQGDEEREEFIFYAVGYLFGMNASRSSWHLLLSQTAASKRVKFNLTFLGRYLSSVHADQPD